MGRGGTYEYANYTLVLEHLTDLYEISHMHPIRPYENDSLCEIDITKKRGGGKNYFKQIFM